MGAGERSKGKKAEREVAALVQEWWRRLEPECIFRTTPASGGLRGAFGHHDAAAFNMAGDLMTTAERWPFVVEVKRRERWNYDRLASGASSPVLGWWAQCVRDAVAQGGRPMMWFRRSREPWSVALDARVAQAVREITGQADLQLAEFTVCRADVLLCVNPRWMGW